MEHPSNKFYEGCCTSIDDALNINVQQFAYEKSLSWPKEEKTKPTFTEGWKDACALRNEYLKKVGEFRDNLMQEWLQREGQAKSIAEAYFSGDYSTLSI